MQLDRLEGKPDARVAWGSDIAAQMLRRFVSWPVETVIAKINPVLRGWVNYFRVGHSSICFGVVKRWVEEKVRRHLMRARGRQGFGWTRWSSEWLYDRLGLFNNYQLVRWSDAKVAPARWAT